VPDARVLITIREQDSLALSWYRSHGRFAMYLFLHKFESERVAAHLTQQDWWTFVTRDANAGLLAMLDLDAVVACYERRFAGRVAVLPLELLAAGRSRAAAILGEVLEVDPSRCGALMSSAHENRGLSAREARMSRWLLRFGIRADFLEARDRGPFRRWLAKGPLADGALDPAIVAEIRRRYASGNARLAMRTGLPLDALGYACAGETAPPPGERED